jgi:hypothetical protein
MNTQMNSRTPTDTTAVVFGTLFLGTAAAVGVDAAGWFDVSFGSLLAVALLVGGAALLLVSLRSKRQDP